MRAVKYEDILSIEEYNKKRNEYREKIMDIKKTRRFHLGSMFTFLFENYYTVWYQIQEMIRAEGITDKNSILFEINTYNELIPNKGEIKATLLIEIDDPEFRKYKLKELLGLEKHVFFFFERDQNIYEIMGKFDDRQFNRERISSVQYITFSFNEEQTKEFLNSKKAGIKVTHPAYHYMDYLSLEQLNSVKEDFENTLQ